MRYFFINGSKNNAGKIVNVVAAANWAISTPLWVLRVDRPIGNVEVAFPDKIKTKINSFQLNIKPNKPAAIKPGAIKGMETKYKAWNLVAPSDLAADSIKKISRE